MDHSATRTRDADGYFVELADRDLTDAERYAFGISDVRPIAGLQHGNSDLDVAPWSGAPTPALPVPQCYPSQLQALVPVVES